jgi:H+/Cl- antiporter ClcA
MSASWSLLQLGLFIIFGVLGTIAWYYLRKTKEHLFIKKELAIVLTFGALGTVTAVILHYLGDNPRNETLLSTNQYFSGKQHHDMLNACRSNVNSLCYRYPGYPGVLFLY